MKQKFLITSALLITIGSFSNLSLAAPKSPDTSRDAFINETLLAKWKPSENSVSFDKPNVDKSIARFINTLEGKIESKSTPSNKVVGNSESLKLYTNQFYN